MVGLELKHILWALIVAVIVYAIREVRRRRFEIRPRRPEMILEEAWGNWLAGIPKHPDRRFIPDTLTPKAMRPTVRADTERYLRHLARQIRDSDDYERHIVRRMILGNATLALQLDALTGSSEEARRALIKGYEEGMAELIYDAVDSSTLNWIVLREYARWKFDDAVTGDWFHNYMATAGPYVKEKVRLAKAHVLTADSGAGRFAALYDTLLGELRDQMLRARPKRRFPPSDLSSV